jgi:hypothetical protein
MSAARVHFLDLDYTKQGIAATQLLAQVKKFMGKTKDRDQLREAQDMVDALPGIVERFRDMSKKGQELALLKIDKPETKESKAPVEQPAMSNSEVAKAAKAIGFDTKDLSKLAKVLNGPRDKWADELSKLAKSLKMDDTDGKAMVVKLNKLDFIRKMSLIDI